MVVKYISFLENYCCYEWSILMYMVLKYVILAQAAHVVGRHKRHILPAGTSSTHITGSPLDYFALKPRF